MPRGVKKQTTSAYVAPNSVLSEEPMQDMNLKYVYVLADRNEPRGMVYEGLTNKPMPEQAYKKWHNILLTCAIIWDGSDGKAKGRRLIRYYDGCETLFVDEQPKDTASITRLIETTQPIVFNFGKIEVYGYETMKKKYLDMCSWNVDSKYRVPNAPGIFKLLNAEKENESLLDEIELLDQVMDWAKEASESKMLVHARYLGIEEVDIISQNPLSMKSIRAKYRDFARKNPQEFAKSFNDNSIEIKYWIQQALDMGHINTTNFPNKAVWRDTNAEICDISGLKSREGVSTKIFEYSQTSEGEDFVQQLKALYQ